MQDVTEGSTVKRALKAAARLLLGPYRFNRIYRSASTEIEPDRPHGVGLRRLEDVPPPSMASAELRDRFGFGGHDADGYGLYVDGCLAAACWFWGRERFNDPLLWSLGGDEAALVDVITAPIYRGRGLAPVLIRYASAEMRRAGRNSLYAWIWHTHHASYHAFEKAGWQQVAWVLEIHPFGMRRAIRLSWHPVRWRARRNAFGRSAECRRG